MSKRTVAIVDGNSLVHRAFHALPPSMTAPDGRPTNAAFGFVSMLAKMVADLEPYGVVVAFDKGKPQFRIDALAAYKIQRPPMDDTLRVQFPIVREILEALDVPIVEADGWEGDDILGTLAEKAKGCGVYALLVTGDRDALQLVEDGCVAVVSTRKGLTDIVVYDEAGVKEKTGVTPAQIPDYLGLKGDTSDNIPGIPGVGEKTAAKLIAEHGSLEAVFAHAGEVPGKLGENLRANFREAEASKLVATIRRDVPLDIDLDDVRWGSWDRARVERTFGELRFRTLLERVLATAAPGAAARSAAEPGAASGGATPALSVIDEFGGSAVEVVCAGPPRGPAAEGADALRTLRTHTGGSWLGVAIDDGAGETLFPAEGRVLGVVGGREAAVLRDEQVVKGLSGLFEGDRIACADAKALLQAICPPGEATPEAACVFDSVDPARVFDCSLAAYLLESNRANYEIGRLAEDYLGCALPETSDPAERAAAVAGAVHDLEPVLRRKLEETASAECFDKIEMPLVPVLARMEDAGVGVDVDVLARISSELEGQIDELREQIYEEAGAEFTIDSPKQLAEVLFEKLQLPSGKRTKTGYSTDASVLSNLAPSYPICGHVTEYRELTKLKSTYIDSLPRLVAADGRLHTSFNQTVAATGRLSSSNPNLQNIPVRSEVGRRIRAAFVPANPGDLIVTADYSQIELRVLAHLSEDEALIEAFTSGADFHAATAARVFGTSPEDVDAEQRRRAKAVNFGIVYGISAHGLSVSLGIGRAEAQEMIDRYFGAYPGVRRYLDETVASAYREGFAATIFGRRRYIPELRSSNRNLRSFGERTAMNHPMQGSAADIMKLAMIEVDRRLRSQGLGSRMLLQVHDELVFEAPPGELGALDGSACEAMTRAASLKVPLEVNVASAGDWASAK